MPTIELLPTLDEQQKLYSMPRGLDRFREYLRTMLNDSGDDLELPLVHLNPMGKEHCGQKVQALQAIDAEGIASKAAREAASVLPQPAHRFKLSLVVVDDAQGGWTHRELTEAKDRFSSLNAIKHGWMVVPCWTSHETTEDSIQKDTRETVYRLLWAQFHGQPKTLADLLEQEGNASVFAGSPRCALDSSEAEALGNQLSAHLQSSSFPLQFAAMYGDELAESVGYEAIGVGTRAGYDYAHFVAEQPRESPTERLHRVAGRKSG